MADLLPIGVLIPTRNCAALARDHVASLQPWAGRVAEIVVVDSDSRDGTVEIFQAGLSGLPVKYLNHPPGLYQSWNFGIQKIRAKYTYISTVGDSITRDGLEHLCSVAEQCQSDVVLSKPRFIDAAGNALPEDRWLIDVILDRLQIRQPRLLSPSEQFLLAVTNLWGAILGSSASDLYRTACLQQRPFPVEYGTAGDGAWGITNIFDAKIAVTPGSFSTFRHHPKAYSLEDYRVDSLALKCFRLAQRIVATQRADRPVVAQILESVHWTELEPALETAALAQDKLEKLRHRKIPGFMHPAVWQARAARTRARRQIDAITRRVLG